MKFGKRKLAVAFGALLGVGMVGQASADVYGLAYLDIDDLIVLSSGTAGLYTFSTNQDAILNSTPDPVAGNASCSGNFLAGTTNCAVGPPTLSGTVQNAPPAIAGVRAEGTYNAFGQVGNYSNAEAEIISAVLTLDPVTHAKAISESNLANDGGQSAQANTNILSNTRLILAGGAGVLSLSFTATIDLQAEVSGVDSGLAQSAASTTLTLVRNGETLVSWSPSGAGAGSAASVCRVDLGLTCTITGDPRTLNYTATSDGILNQVAGTGAYGINITGLADGNYSVALATTTGTDLIRDVPVPGTLLLMGTGLLLGARATRRSKS